MCKDSQPEQLGDLQLAYADPNDLIVPAEHPRTDHDDDPPTTFDHPEHQLIHSVKQFGLLQPILARQTPAGLEIISGRRRKTAAIAANLTRVPVVITTDETADPATLNLAENIARKPLNPIDQANALSRIGKDHSARQLSIDPALVARSLNLLDLDPYIQDLIATGQLSEAAANELHRAEPDHRRELADRAVDKQLDPKQIFRQAPYYANKVKAERQELKIHAQSLIDTLNDILKTKRARLLMSPAAPSGNIFISLRTPEETLCFARRLSGETVPDPPARAPKSPRRRHAQDPYTKPKWTATYHDRKPQNLYHPPDFQALYLPDHSPRYGLHQAIALNTRIFNPYPSSEQPNEPTPIHHPDPRQRLPPLPTDPVQSLIENL